MQADRQMLARQLRISERHRAGEATAREELDQHRFVEPAESEGGARMSSDGPLPKYLGRDCELSTTGLTHGGPRCRHGR